MLYNLQRRQKLGDGIVFSGNTCDFSQTMKVKLQPMSQNKGK